MDSAHTKKHRKPLLVWIPLLLLTWGVWLWNIDLGSLSFDETATYFVINRPPLEILSYLLHAANEHPPVYYLLIRGWMDLVGASEFSLRLFSLEIGMLLLVISGWLARLASRRLGGTALKGVGWLTAVFLASTPGMAFYARDARMYSLTAVWAATASALLLRDWLMEEKRPSFGSIILLTTINGLAILTHYYLLFFIITQPLALLAGKRWRNLGIWSLIHGLPAILGLLWLSAATGLQATLANAFTESQFIPPTTYQLSLLFTTMLSSSMSTAQYYIQPVILIMIGGGVMAAWYRRWRIGAWLLITLFTPFILAHLLPRIPQTRYLVFLLPFVALAVAHFAALPVAFIRNRPVRWATRTGSMLFIAWLLVNTGMYQVLTIEKSGYGRSLEIIELYARTGDEMLFYGPWQGIPFHYYGTDDIPPRTVVPPSAPPLLDPIKTAPVLKELLARANRLWMVPMAEEAADPDGFVWEWLRANAHAVWEEDDAYLYLSPLPNDTPVETMELSFGNMLVLTGMAHEATPIPAGEPMRVTFSWEFLHLLDDGVEIELALVDSDGYVWATAYSTLINGQTTSYEGLTIPQDAPVDDYRLRLRLLDNASGLPMLINGAETALLKTIQIVVPVHEPILSDAVVPDTITFCPPDEGACVNLVGIELASDHSPPGYPIRVNLRWQAPSKLQSGTVALPVLQARFQLIPDPPFYALGIDNSPILTKTVLLSPPYPSNQWIAERLVMQPLVLSVPPDAQTGRAKITLEVMDENGRLWISSTSSQPLADIIIEKRSTLTTLPDGLTSIEADFGDEIGLRGYHMEGNWCPGEQLELNYGWYALKRPLQVYAVFNHLVTTDDTIVAQVDGWPQGGRLLTSQWQPGEYIEDSYTLIIPADAPVGPYTLYTGLYEIESGARLPVLQNGEHSPADHISITLPEQCD